MKETVDTKFGRMTIIYSENVQKTNYCPECDRLSKENERLRDALEMITGKRRCPDHLMGNVDIAQWALESEAGDEV